MAGNLALLASDRPVACRYAREVLDHAGIFPVSIHREQLPGAIDEFGIILLSGYPAFNDSERSLLEGFVRGGGVLISVGSTCGLDDLFGVEMTKPLGEGYIQLGEKSHPITDGLESSLHVFGGVGVRASAGRSLATMRDSLGRPIERDAIIEHETGDGLAILIAPDIFGSIVRIQQGIYVDQDGVPASDGSAPLNDGILKCEDGMVLNFELDRTAVDGENPVFYHPIADELREIVIKSVLYGAWKRHLPLIVLWYYPRGLPALGHLSHDSDGNDPRLNWMLLDVVREIGVESTWCIIEPGYSADFYSALKDGGYEIALHYDALDGRPRTSWGKHQLLGQCDWLSRATGIKPVSNKNHYTRWEGRIEFFRWCESVGIRCDQSKGPSKRGTIGYPFGGSHPWFPIDGNGRFIDCMELNLQTQDLIVTCPEYFGNYWIDQTVRHHGIAHLLFHPAHIGKPGVADALRKIVQYGRENGLEWWTCARINDWERSRRDVELIDIDGDRMRVVLAARQPLDDATVLMLSPDGTPDVCRYGFPFRQVTTDINGEKEIEF